MDQNPYQSPAKGEPIRSEPAVQNRATGRELFGVVVRGIGLYFILTGMSNLVYVVFLLGGAIPTAPIPNAWKLGRMAFEWIVPGIIPFFFPNFVVSLAYRDELTAERPDSISDPTEEDNTEEKHVDS